MGEEKNVESRQKYVLEIEEPEQFKQVYSGLFTTSILLAKKIKEFFKIAFSDVEGARIDYENNALVLRLFMNHGDHSGDALPTAIERFNQKSSGSRTLDSIRARDNLLSNGDKYFVTDDGADVFEQFLNSKFFKGNKKPDWKKLTNETYDSTVQSGFYYGRNMGMPLTQISGLDLSKVLTAMYGDKDENGNNVEYAAFAMGRIQNNMMGFNAIPNYALMIIKANEGNIIEACKEIGLEFQSSNIVR